MSIRNTPHIIKPLIIVILSAVLGAYIGINQLTYFEFILVIVVTVIFIILLSNDTSRPEGLALTILLCSLGQRGLDLPLGLVIYPPTVLLVFLTIQILLSKRVKGKSYYTNGSWAFGWGFQLFVVYGALIGLISENPQQTLMTYLLSLFTFVPAVIVVSHVLNDKNNEWHLAVAIICTGTAVAVIGILELHVEAFRQLVGNFLTPEGTVFVAQDGFQRAVFSFYGGPTASFVCIISLPFFYFVSKQIDGFSKRMIIGGAVLLNLYIIYQAGFRSMWFLTACLIVLYVFSGARIWGTIFTILLFLLTFSSLPTTTFDRANTLFSALSGHIVDTSSQERFNRAITGINETLERPSGYGLGYPTLIHIDYLQVAHDLGILGGAVFLIWYLGSLYRIARIYWRTNNAFSYSLLGSMLVIGVTLLTQPVIARPFFFILICIIWAMSHVHCEQNLKILR